MEPASISIIIPCYNSAAALAKNLPYLLDNLRQTTIPFEVIVVNDGSKDETILRETIMGFPVVYLSNGENLGKGAALRNGFKAATGDIQVFTDPDIPYSFKAISQVIQILSSKEADLVLGNRLSKDSEYYHRIGIVRSWGSRLVSFFLGTLVTGGYYDTQCGIKGFTKEAAAKLFDWSSVDRFAIDIELIYLALKFHYRIRKIPVKFRSADGNTVRVFSDGIQLLRDVFRIKLHYEKRKKQERLKNG